MIQKTIVRVEGMSCAACQARIEKSLRSLDGLEDCYANFSNGRVSVSYDDEKVTLEDIHDRITKAGYSVVVKGAEQQDDSAKILRDLLFCIVFTIPVVVLSMGPMFGLVILDAVPSAVIQLILTTLVVIFGRRFFVRGIPALIECSPTMDTLVALGSGVAYIYSIVLTASVIGGESHHLYYESAAMIITLVSVGKYLEARSKKRTNDAVNGLKKLVPDDANIIIDGKEVTVKVGDLKVGNILLIRPGERVPADACVTEGHTNIDESMLTGESVPVPKDVGSDIYGGTVNSNGSIRASVTAVGEDTALSKIISMIEETQSTKAPVAKLADRVASVFVPVVMLIALITLAAWSLIGNDFTFAMTSAISVLVISCPCAMGLATPLAITVGTGKAAEYGILFKNATALETSGKVDTVILDKTGTITEGRPVVVEIYPPESSERILSLAASAEYSSEHPLGMAISRRAEEEGMAILPTEGFESDTGSGIRCIIGGRTIRVGNSRDITIPEEMAGASQRMASEGRTVVYVSEDDAVIGMIGISDSIRSDSASAVSSLRSMGIDVHMVTGDTEATANAVASEVGIDNVVHSALPADKVMAVKKLQAKQRNVAMVGDGINDAPALMQSDLGIAVGSGTDIAMDSADVVLMNDSISNIPITVRIARATLKNIKENLFWAFCYNIVCIPIAAGVPHLFGMSLIHEMPMLAAAAMSLSSLCVVFNALRLKGLRPKAV